MKPLKFLAQFQQDLFPNRSTVGHEIAAILLAAPTPKVFGSLTEIPAQPTSPASKAQQPSLPIERVRRSWWRR